MLDLTIEVNPGRTFEGFHCELITQGDAVHGDWSIPEDAQIRIQLIASDKALEFGTPILYIGDVAHEMSLTTSIDDQQYWCVLFDEEQIFGTPFRNFVGRSEIILTFRKVDIHIRNLVDIQANLVNAELAESMLKYLNTHYESIVSLCFSRSKINGDTSKGNEDSINRLIVEAQNGIKLCESVWPELLSRVRERWETELQIQKSTLPNSSQGITWLTQHPEYIHFCHQEEQMLRMKGYPTKIIQGVREEVIQNRDLLENRIIHGYLAHMEQKLTKTRKLLVIDSIRNNEKNSNSSFGEYISLDHILNKYRTPILEGLSKKLDNLVSRVRFLRNNFSYIVPPSMDLKPIPPTVTSFVARTPSYLRVYEKITRWYEFNNIEIGIGDLLFGLRHLSTLYEFTVLTQLISALKDTGANLLEQSWRDYNEAKFGGEAKARPMSEINNYFYFSNESRKMEIELFYEPKIWTKHKAQSGDPVDVCIEHQGKDWQYRSPDYMLRIWIKGIVEPVLLILDAKFSSAYRIKHEKLPDLVNKYLLGLHQKRADGSYGRLPIQAVWALYPKGQSEKVDFYASYHSIGGRESILPSLGGIRVKPNEEARLSIMLNKLFQQIEQEFEQKYQNSHIKIT
ncbi:nuclease domain-containing protein [Xenorhabdus entomophaga]|uniref:nuclease domain-containing protein n=1 Tax=Xenorhabdus entomophaga TaxID=3136257 RepID=UPI0030F39991